MAHLLQSVDIANFRTIQGQVSVPLDASVVLIHGANGAGKTSLLSAIELAMTGEVDALKRAEPNYAAHLQNQHGACSVTLHAIAPTTNEPNVAEFRVADGSIVGTPVLDAHLRTFFADRCFLAQSLLGRLLEIYQHSDSTAESPLVRFVNDLLGLDQLDNLILGLYPAGDERRVRRLVPEFDALKHSLDTLAPQIAVLDFQLAAHRTEAGHLFVRIRTALEMPGETGDMPTRLDLEGIRVQLEPDAFDAELEQLKRASARLTQIQQDVADLPAQSTSGESTVLDADAWAKLESQWRASAGQSIQSLLTEVTASLPDVPGVLSGNPEMDLQRTSDRLGTEVERLRSLIHQDAERGQDVDNLQSILERQTAELSTLQEELARLTLDAGSLVQALASLATHVSSDECPVCGRDFSEVSSRSLASHLEQRISAYSAQAERVGEVLGQQASLQTDVARRRSDIASAKAALWTDVTRSDIEHRLESAMSLSARLVDLMPSAADGTSIIQGARSRATRLAELGELARVETSLRARLRDEWQTVFGADIEPPADLSAAIDELRVFVDNRMGALNKHLDTRSALQTMFDELSGTVDQITSLEERQTADRSRLASLRAAEAETRRRFTSAREIVRAASGARAAIVGTVFNGSLNNTWHELFIRLAPDEPYVPSFGLPTAEGRLTSVRLETVHRVAGIGGSPGAMLSAGNLNTAALTLFLALHLSVEPAVRCLILDDPIQSMDEVHISQFAALVRTLSRQHDRQVVLAVHDQGLFEYLKLELSPTYAGAKLITVELERREASDTRCTSTNIEWTEDHAVLAVAGA